jgi:hypothetical protein
MRSAGEYGGMRLISYHLNRIFELIETGAVPKLVCHCEHCGVVRVPSFQVRSWLSEADVIFLPGLDGWLVIANAGVQPRAAFCDIVSDEWNILT